MTMKNKHILAYMECARIFATLSSAVRLQVGCVVVKNDSIIGIGYNGTPIGWNNDCEIKIFENEDIKKGVMYNEYPYSEGKERYRLVTRPEVIHAESNAIAKITRSTISSEGSTMCITHAPCVECAKLISQTKIKEVYFDQYYRNNEGINFLKRTDVIIKNIGEIL